MPEYSFGVATSTVAVSAVDGTGLTKGDILAATANNAVGRIALGSAGFLGVQPTTGLPVWSNTREKLALNARGVLAEPAPSFTMTASTVPTANAASGTAVLALVGLRAGDVVTNILLPIVTNGTSVSFAKCGLFNSTGGFIAATSSVSATANSGQGAWNIVPLTTAYSVTADGGYYLGYLQYGSGATGATLLRWNVGTVATVAVSGFVRPFAQTANLTDLNGDITPAANSSLQCYLACN